MREIILDDLRGTDCFYQLEGLKSQSEIPTPNPSPEEEWSSMPLCSSLHDFLWMKASTCSWVQSAW